MARGINARRSVLTTMMAVGVVITLTGASGIFAVFTDRATTGTNSYASRAEPRAADLQLAAVTSTGDGTVLTCGTYVDDLATGIIEASDRAPNDGAGSQFLCVRNAGSQSIEVDVSAIDLVDLDHACTGDELAADPDTCGGDLEGELSQQLDVQAVFFECDASNVFTTTAAVTLASMETTPVSLFSLMPGAVRCVGFAHYFVVDEVESQHTQSDTAQWKYAFDAATA